jgi:hypothetical protein
MQQWMPAVLSLFGTLMVVVVTAWLNTKALSSQIDTLRAEVKLALSEFRMEMHVDLTDLKHRVERLEEQRGGLVRP